MKLLEQIKREIEPDLKRVLAKVNKVVDKINKSLKRRKVNAACIVGGSIAKETFLKGDHDCDLFVKFNFSYKKDNISDILEKSLKSFPKAERLHGSRDYFQFKEAGINYEVVPVFDIKKAEEALNVTDISPLHVSWVRSFNIPDEIRLTKLFCKAQGVYGAESYIKGFSGHVLDILTVYYGSFLKLLKASKRWKEKDVVDFYDIHKGRALRFLNRSKVQSAFIVIDPIQPDRNASAVLSKEKFNIFREAARAFLKKPSKKFFVKEELTEDKIKVLAKKRKNSRLILLKVASLDGKEDIVGAKLMKAFEYIEKQSKLSDFKIKDSGWTWDRKKKALFYFIGDKKPLSKTVIWQGPPLKHKNDTEVFKQKHKKCYIKGDRVYAEVKREYRELDKFINHLIRKDYIKERVKSIK